ncbi:MAG TPA: histidine phosphatase family protein [Burkholderiales bacterium]
MEQKWPDMLWIVRHGQSAGNVARDAAVAADRPLIDIAERDMDVPLSAMGKQQALALGHWFGDMPAEQQPTIVLCSPYVRARQTAQYVLEGAGLSTEDLTFHIDERLREKEFGVIDRLTQSGIRLKYPELHEQRAHVGKFYFRPPGGESWCDVILRLRGVLGTMTRGYRGERVLIIGHQVIVTCMRYLLERMDEAQILEIDSKSDVPNCGVTSYEFDPTLGRKGKLVPRLVNFVVPLQQAGATVTTERDVPAAPKS